MLKLRQDYQVIDKKKISVLHHLAKKADTKKK